MRSKRLISMFLAFVFIVSSTFAATPIVVMDMPDGWSIPAVTEAVNDEILDVKDGYVRPMEMLTRAEMAYGIVNAFGATKEVDLSNYIDVSKDTPYYAEIAKAVAMGAISGYGNGLLKPEDTISREEMFAVIYNALELEEGNLYYLNKFNDKHLVSEWAKGIVARMAQNNYVAGNSKGNVKPTENITREEFAQVMKNIFSEYYDEAGTYTNIPEGTIVVNVPSVTLKDAIVTEDLVIADGVGNGDVILDNVTVLGRTIVRGGGENSIKLINGTDLKGKVIVNNKQNKVRIYTEKSKVSTIDVETEAILEGEFTNVSVNKPVTIEVKGNISNVTVNEKSKIKVTKGTIENVTVNSNAKETKITGKGKVTEVVANANDVTVETSKTQVTAGSNTTGVKAGKAEVKAGKTATVKTSSGGGGGGGGGGGSSSSSNRVTLPTLQLTDIANGGKIDLGENYSKFQVSYVWDNEQTMWYTATTRYLTPNEEKGSEGWGPYTKIVKVKYGNTEKQLRIRQDTPTFEVDKLNGKIVIPNFEKVKSKYEYKIGDYNSENEYADLISESNLNITGEGLLIREKVTSALLESNPQYVYVTSGTVKEISEVKYDNNNKPYRTLKGDNGIYYQYISCANNNDKYLSKLGEGKTLLSKDFGIKVGDSISIYNVEERIKLESSDFMPTEQEWAIDIKDIVLEVMPRFELHGKSIELGQNWEKYQVAYSNDVEDFNTETVWKDIVINNGSGFDVIENTVRFDENENGEGILEVNNVIETDGITKPTYFAIRLKNNTNIKQIIQVREIAEIKEIINNGYHTAVKVGADYQNYEYSVYFDNGIDYFNNKFTSQTISLPADARIDIVKDSNIDLLPSAAKEIYYNFEEKDITEMHGVKLDTRFGLIYLGEGTENYTYYYDTDSWYAPSEANPALVDNGYIDLESVSNGYKHIPNFDEDWYTENQNEEVIIANMNNIVIKDSNGTTIKKINLSDYHQELGDIEIDYENQTIIVEDPTLYEYRNELTGDWQLWDNVNDDSDLGCGVGDVILLRKKGTDTKLSSDAMLIKFAPNFELNSTDNTIDVGRNCDDYEVAYKIDKEWTEFYTVQDRYLGEQSACNGYGWSNDVTHVAIRETMNGLYTIIEVDKFALEATVGMVVRTPEDKIDENDVDYYTVKVLTSDNVKTTYKVYMKDEDAGFPTWFTTMPVGTVVVFSADASNVITLDESKTDKEEQGIAIISANDDFTADGGELKVVAMADVVADYDAQTVTIGEDAYRFDSSSVLYNTNEAKLEIVSTWDSVCEKDGEDEDSADEHVFTSKSLIIVDGTKVKYCVFNATKYMDEEAKYAVLVDIDDIRNEEEDKVYVATLYVEGKEVDYELDVSSDVREALVAGNFVNYTVSNNKIIAISTVVYIDAIDDIDEYESIEGLIVGAQDIPSTDVIKARFEVEDVDDGFIYFVDDVAKTSNEDYAAITELILDEAGCIIYDLRNGDYEMFDGELADLEGLYVVGFLADKTNEDVDILVIFDGSSNSSEEIIELEATVGMVVRVPEDKVDENEVDYYTVKILTSDNVKTTYKVYMKDEDAGFPTWFTTMPVGTVVVFSADASNVITLDESKTDKEEQGIAIISANDDFTADGGELKVVAMTDVVADYDAQTVTIGEDAYRFDSSSVLYNTNEAKLEIVSTWDSVCEKDGEDEDSADEHVFTSKSLIIVDGTKVKYCVFNATKYMDEEPKYAVLVDIDDIRNEEEDKVYVATLCVNGKEVDYELDVSSDVREALVAGNFVKYVISNDKITNISTVVYVEDIADAEQSIEGLIVGAYGIPSTDVIAARFEVAEVADEIIYFVDDVAKDATTDYEAIPELVIDEAGCIIYDLRDGDFQMFDGELADLEGLYVVGFLSDTNNTDVDILVIFDGSGNNSSDEVVELEATVGMIVREPSDKVDENDVDYYTLKILTSDSIKTTYKVYMEDEDDNFPEWFTSIAVGTVVVFSSDDNNIITLDESKTYKEEQGIAIVNVNDEFTADGSDLIVVAMTDVVADYDKQTVEIDGTLYRFDSSSIMYNINEDKLEIVSNWSSVCEKDSEDTVFTSDSIIIVEGTRVKYCSFNAEKYMSEATKYAVLTNVEYRKDSDDDKVYMATLFIEGEEVEYELNVDQNVRETLYAGDFIKCVVSDDEIITISTVVYISNIADVEVEQSIEGLIVGAHNTPSTDVIKARFEVDEIDDGYIYFIDDVVKYETTNYDAIPELVLDVDGYMIYDLRDGSYDMFDGVITDLEGLYVIGFLGDTDNEDVDILVIFE